MAIDIKIDLLKSLREKLRIRFSKSTHLKSGDTVGATVQAIVGPPFFASLFDPLTGQFMIDASIYFYEQDGITPQPVYPSPDTTGTAYPNPYVITSPVAAEPPFYYLDSVYMIKIFADGATDPTYSFTFTPGGSSASIIEVAQVDDMVLSSGQALSSTDVTLLSKAATNYTLQAGFFVDSGTANNYICTRDTGVLFPLPTADADMVFYFKPANDNTGASTMTLPLSTTGTISGALLNASDGSALVAGQISAAANSFYTIERNKTAGNFYIKTNPTTPAGQTIIGGSGIYIVNTPTTATVYRNTNFGNNASTLVGVTVPIGTTYIVCSCSCVVDSASDFVEIIANLQPTAFIGAGVAYFGINDSVSSLNSLPMAGAGSTTDTTILNTIMWAGNFPSEPSYPSTKIFNLYIQNVSSSPNILTQIANSSATQSFILCKKFNNSISLDSLKEVVGKESNLPTNLFPKETKNDD